MARNELSGLLGGLVRGLVRTVNTIPPLHRFINRKLINAGASLRGESGIGIES